MAIKQEALLAGCKVYGSLTQSEFLKNMGIELRAEILKRNANKEQVREIDSGLLRLIDSKEMGSLFKVMSISYSQ